MIVATAGEHTKKLAPPLRVFWWILLLTFWNLVPKVWNHSPCVL
jgi:hypothetical protein